MTSRLTYLMDYFKYLKNPISCLLFKFGLKKEILIKFKNNEYKLKLKEKESINLLLGSMRLHEYTSLFGNYVKKYDSDKKVINVTENIKIYNPRLFPLNSVFQEYFLDYYSDFDIDYKNRCIIDIGANCGDSALYFASNGAKVYAFEPVRDYYGMAIKNFDLNHELKKNIKIFNYGVSYKKGKLNINSMESTSGYISEDDLYDVDIISLDDITKKITPDILKMDCEGCEFEIIENCDLSVFNEIIFEYHSKIVGKNHEPLIDKLKKEGFNIKISSVFGSNLDDLGIIYAYKS